MEREREIETISMEIRILSAKIRSHYNEECGWCERLADKRQRLERFLGVVYFERMPDELAYSRVAGYYRFVTSAVNSLEKTARELPEGTEIEKEIYELLCVAANVGANIKEELLLAEKHMQKSETARRYDARLMAYYEGDESKCKDFYDELAKLKSPRPQDVKRIFLYNRPKILKLHRAEMAKFLTDVSKVGITRQNLGEIEDYCKINGIEIENNPNMARKKKQ